MRSESETVQKLTKILPEIGLNLRVVSMLEKIKPGLNIVQLSVLVILGESLEKSMTSGELAEKLGVSLPTVTGVADCLVRDGLLVRKRQEDDRRVVRVCLTPKGTDLMARLSEEFQRLIERVLERMDESDRKAVLGSIEAFQKLTSLLKEEQKSAHSALA